MITDHPRPYWLSMTNWMATSTTAKHLQYLALDRWRNESRFRYKWLGYNQKTNKKNIQRLMTRHTSEARHVCRFEAIFGTDEVRAKRELSLCNESVNGHFWSNLCLNCIFKWTWFVKTSIWSVIDRSRVRFPVAAALIIFLFSSIFLSFLTRFLFCPTRISKVGKCTAFQLWTPTYF